MPRTDWSRFEEPELELLQAYHDGELDAEQEQEVVRRLSRDRAYRDLLSRFETLDREVEALTAGDALPLRTAVARLRRCVRHVVPHLARGGWLRSQLGSIQQRLAAVAHTATEEGAVRELLMAALADLRRLSGGFVPQTSLRVQEDAPAAAPARAYEPHALYPREVELEQQLEELERAVDICLSALQREQGAG